MAYTDYTPSAVFDPTVSIPDDAELEASGIGAVNAGLEGLADRTEYNANRIYVTGANYGEIDVSILERKNTTALYSWEETMVDVDALVGDIILVTYSLVVVTTNPTPACVVSLIAAPAAIAPLTVELQSIKVFASTRAHICLQGTYVVANNGVHEFKLTFQNDGAGGGLGFDVFDGITTSLVRYRP
jgi:hypothetical protein